MECEKLEGKAWCRDCGKWVLIESMNFEQITKTIRDEQRSYILIKGASLKCGHGLTGNLELNATIKLELAFR